jgi:hypothetical protein
MKKILSIVDTPPHRKVLPDTGKRAVQPKGNVVRKPDQRVTSQMKAMSTTTHENGELSGVAWAPRRRVLPDTGKRAIQPRGNVVRKPDQRVTSQMKPKAVAAKTN